MIAGADPYDGRNQEMFERLDDVFNKLEFYIFQQTNTKGNQLVFEDWNMKRRKGIFMK